MKHPGKMFGVVAGAVVALVAAPARSEAVLTVTDAWIFSEFVTVPGLPTGVPFDFTGTDGVKLTLGGAGEATAFVDVGLTGPFSIETQLFHSSHTGVINNGEAGGTTAAHVDSEVGTLDDVGLEEEGSDALLNLDFGNDATVTFAAPDLGLFTLLLGEDAGLDVFKLEHCATADCAAPVTLFNGMTAATKAGILGRPDFGSNDTAPDIDQLHFFLFSEPLFGFVRISETTNFGGTKLEVDFLGGSSVAPPIPEPASMLLFGLGGFGVAGVALRALRVRKVV